MFSTVLTTVNCKDTELQYLPILSTMYESLQAFYRGAQQLGAQLFGVVRLFTWIVLILASIKNVLVSHWKDFRFRGHEGDERYSFCGLVYGGLLNMSVSLLVLIFCFISKICNSCWSVLSVCTVELYYHT